MAVDYATLKKGGFMRQKQKNNFSSHLPSGCGDSIYQIRAD